MQANSIIIWTQNESVEKGESIFIDGEKIDINDTMYKISFKKIAELQNLNKTLFSKGNLKIKCKQIDKQYKCYLIQSCFQEVDLANRNMAFMAYIPKARNLKEACNQLIAETKRINRHCKTEDIETINFIQEKSSSIKRYFLIIILIILLLLIIII